MKTYLILCVNIGQEEKSTRATGLGLFLLQLARSDDERRLCLWSLPLACVSAYPSVPTAERVMIFPHSMMPQLVPVFHWKAPLSRTPLKMF